MTCEVGEAVKAGAAVGIALGSARLEYRFGHSAIEGLVMMCGSMAWAGAVPDLSPGSLPGITRLGRVGVSSSTQRAASAGVVTCWPVGRVPVSIWYSSNPKLQMSVAVVTGSPRTCSGLA